MSSHIRFSPNSISKILFGNSPRRTLIRTLFLATATIVLVRYVAKPVRLRGISMDPTLRDGSFHVLNLQAFRFRPPRRGDIVAVRMTGDRTYYLKRILAEPGDRISFVNGVLYINGDKVEEPYVWFKGGWTMPEIALQSGEYFVAGDNRAGSPDQHVAGIVQRNQIAGSLLF